MREEEEEESWLGNKSHHDDLAHANNEVKASRAIASAHLIHAPLARMNTCTWRWASALA